MRPTLASATFVAAEQQYKVSGLRRMDQDELLSVHTEDCVLADTIHDMIHNASYSYTRSCPSRPQTPEAVSPSSSTPSCTSSPRKLLSKEPAAITPYPLTSNKSRSPRLALVLPPTHHRRRRVTPLPEIATSTIQALSTFYYDTTSADN